MAMNDESKSSQNVAAALVTVELDESDNPGAALSAPLGGHTVPELKWWLLCRGIKPYSLKKVQLIGRYIRGRQLQCLLYFLNLGIF